MRTFVYEIASKSDFDIAEMEVDKDHMHLMIESVPKISPLQIIRRLKQETTIQIWKLYPELKKYFLE
jgi:putative transposase